VNTISKRVALPKAYVEIRTLPGWQGSVIRDLERMRSGEPASSIRDCDVIFGDYDLMVVVEHEDKKVLHKAIGDISRLSGVSSTNSRVVMDKEDIEESLGSTLRPSKLFGAP
jgi:DNA-binding Lrp family transcriptional regulator